MVGTSTGGSIYDFLGFVEHRGTIREIASVLTQLQDTERWIRSTFPFKEHMEHSQAVRRPTCSRELRSVCHERRDGSRTSTRDSGGERYELENPRCKNQNATFEFRRCLRTDLSKPANELETVASAPGRMSSTFYNCGTSAMVSSNSVWGSSTNTS